MEAYARERDEAARLRLAAQDRLASAREVRARSEQRVENVERALEQLQIDLEVARSEAASTRNTLSELLHEWEEDRGRARADRRANVRDRDASETDRTAAADDRRASAEDREASRADREQAIIDTAVAASESADPTE